jgi:hypothetical protein
MIVTLGSIRGAPGVTSWSLLLAAAWPSDIGADRVVLEADPAGGVLGARYGWGVEPGVVALVTQLRRDSGGRTFSIQGAERKLGDGVSVVPGPETADRARRIWQSEAGTVAPRLAGDARVWFVDVGRVHDGDPTAAFVDESTMFILVSGGRPEDLVQVPARLQALRRRCDSVALLVNGPCAYGVDELTAFSDADMVWLAKETGDLVDDAVNALTDSRSRRRSWLWRRALEISSAIAAQAAQVDVGGPTRVTERAR